MVPRKALIIDGEVVPLDEEVSVREAMQILNLSERRVQQLCEEGILLEGRDWRKNPCPGPNGTYLIKRKSVLALQKVRTNASSTATKKRALAPRGARRSPFKPKAQGFSGQQIKSVAYI